MWRHGMRVGWKPTDAYNLEQKALRVLDEKVIYAQ